MATEMREPEDRGARAHVARLLWSAACVCGGALAIALSATAGIAAAAECPNEAIRLQQGAEALALPECRAYEMVSPVGSVPSNLAGEHTRASLSGNRFVYYSWNPYPGQEGESLNLLSTRTAHGWSTQATTPPQAPVRESSNFSCDPSIYYSAELTRGLLADGFREGEAVCEGDEPPLVEGEPRGAMNLFLRDNNTAEYQLVDASPLGAGELSQNAYLADATPEFTHVVFNEKAALTPEAPGAGANDLYEWTGGTVHLLSVLPDGTPTAGTLAESSGAGGHGLAAVTHALSANGERAFFYVYSGEEGALYERINASKPQSAIANASSKVNGEQCTEPAKACTIEVDAAEAGAEGPGGEGMFVDASEGGNRVFFTDARHLTTDATAEPLLPDLYEYDLETGKLTDLTVDGSKAADVIGYSGAGEDGEYLYFVAKGKLTGANTEGKEPVTGEPNLYVSHDAKLAFIATGASGWQSLEMQKYESFEYATTHGVEEIRTRVSPNGRYLAFSSAEPLLTGIDNEPVEAADCAGAKTCSEVFRYDAVEGRLNCVSCGAAPTGPAELRGTNGGPTGYLYGGPELLSRNVLDDGRVFFDTRTPLLVAASNGAENVYQYDEGRLSLISTGTSADDSQFVEASPSGNDVFFETDQGLVQSDTDSADSIYDARVDGGFTVAAQEAAPSACQSAKGCLPPLSEPPVEALSASEALKGAGNLAPPAKTHKKGKSGGEHGRSQKGHKLTRAQRLKKALSKCRRKGRRKRRACKRRARRRYGAKKARHSGHRRHQRHTKHHSHSKHRHAKRADRRHVGRRGGGR